jgi:ferrous iron transport protein B
MTKPRICLSGSALSACAAPSAWSKRVDKLALHPLTAVPFFLLVMYGLFVFAIGFGGIFQDFFEQMARASIVCLAQAWPTTLPLWLSHVLDGLSRGVALTASFIPVLTGLFVGLGALEQSGYMARVARIAEGLTRWIGLPGKAFIPLLVGFGCNVPAVMGTRILHNSRDRILTIMMLPFMSCGARLAIYALFVSAFFAESGYRYIFILYLIGILVAIFTVLIFKHAWFRGTPSNLSTENAVTPLPPYRWPDWRGIFKQSVYRVKKFLRKAGLVIIPCCLVLGSIGELKSLTGIDVEWMGRQLTPIFKPLGIEKDNWPATVGLLTGMFAKEVLVGSLGALYRVDDANAAVLAVDNMVPDAESFGDMTKQAVLSIKQNAQKFVEKLSHPFHLEERTERMQPETQRLMVSCFGSNVAAFSYLLFVLLYFPCISVVVVIAKELNRYWATLSVLWSTGLAYVISVVFYQSFQLKAATSVEAFQIIGMACGLFAVMVLGLYGLGWLWGNRSSFQTDKKAKPIAVKLVT